jgi:hypothetical protein
MSVRMPKRSVTRFFIPMIDVLLLLFCIFLLMPMAEENKLEKAAETIGDLTGENAFARAELQRREDEIQLFEENQDVARAVKRIRDLEAQVKKLKAQKTDIHTIDIDGDTAKIVYYDRTKPQDAPGLEIKDEKSAKLMIKRHKEEAGSGRKVYYLFLYPHGVEGFPNGAQLRRLNEYKNWFNDVENSLKGDRP